MCLFFFCIYIIYNIYNEIKKKTFFNSYLIIIKNNSIWSEKNGDYTYQLFDLIFDLYRILLNIKILFIDIILFLIVFLFLYKLTRYTPLLFFIIFQFHFIKFLLYIIYFKFKGNGKLYVIELKIPPVYFIKLNVIIKISTKTIETWSFNLIYYYLFVKKKFSFKQMERIFFSIVFHIPFWYILFLIKWSLIIIKICKSKIWLKKSYYAWPKIFYSIIKNNMMNSVVINHMSAYSMGGGRKILIKDNLFTLNPLSNELITVITSDGHRRLMQFSEHSIAYFQSKPHQVFSMPNTNHGWIMTTGHSIKTSNRILHTLPVSVDNNKQRMIYSAYNDSIIDDNSLYHHAFWTNNIHTYADYAGLIIRLSMIHNIGESNNMLIQTKNRAEAYLLSQNFTYSDIYMGHININNLLPYLRRIQKIDDRIETLDNILSEIEMMPNRILYNNLLNDASTSNLITQVNPTLTNRYNNARNSHYWI